MGLADVIVTFDDTSTDVLKITNVPYNADTDTFSTQIDLSKEKKGFYTLKAYKAGSTNPLDELDSNDFYVDSNLVLQNVFGIIRVTYADASVSKLYGTTIAANKFYTFNYGFAARSVYWRYYIVAENLPAGYFTTYDLKVKDDTGPLIFFASYPSPWTQPNGQPDPVIRINGLDTVILTSTTKISFSEKALLNINLYNHLKPAGADTKISDNLPNARVDGVDTDQYGAAQLPPTITKDIAEIFVIV
jgi:hypothetical protein